MQDHHQQRAHDGFVPDGEAALFLQAADEDQEDLLVQQEVLEVPEGVDQHRTLVGGDLGKEGRE